MKKRLLLLSLLPIAAVALVAPNFTKIEAVEVKAEASNYSTYTLPSTIDLNPVSETDIRSYYSALNGKNYQGEDLLKALKPILKNGQRYHTYDKENNGRKIWQAYEITDRDWELSPASSTTYGTYDSNTNTIKDYVYGTSKSNSKNNPYVHAYYRNKGVESGYIKAWDDHQATGINREHIWVKSRGFNAEGSYGARGDLHHLVAADGYVNQTPHQDKAYGFVDTTKTYNDAKNKYAYASGNLDGRPLNLPGITTPVFEPQDCDKGDLARACFYMVARYNNLAGDDNTIDAGNPNLFLDDGAATGTIASPPSQAVSYGVLRDLLAWHKLDPVDEYEIHRNDLIYRNYDHNRNPFIDFPEWVDAIWGTVELAEDNRTITNRDTTPKGVASPATDAVYLNGGGSGGGSSSSEPAPSSSGETSSSATPVISSSTSSSGGSGSGSNLPLPLPVIIAIAAGAVIILVILIIVATKGKGKSKKAARKALKNVAKSATKSNKKKK